MKKIFTLLILTVYIVGFVNAQKVPEGLQKLIDDYVKDSSTALGFEDAKRTLNIKFSDIRVGVPIQIFELDREKLENLSDSTNVSLLISPINWEIPIYAKNRCVYTIIAYQKGQNWIFTGYGSGGSSEAWEKVRNAWPEVNGDYFIIVVWGGSRMLHFPDKNSHNLTFIPGYTSNTAFATKDLRELGDSRNVLPHLLKLLMERKKDILENPEPLEMQQAGCNP